MSSTRTMGGKVASPHVTPHIPAIRWEIFPWFLGFLVILTVVAIFHVWSRCRVIDLNMKISDMSRQVKELRQQQTRLKIEVASLKTPSRIEGIARTELGMGLPSEQQVVMVK